MPIENPPVVKALPQPSAPNPLHVLKGLAMAVYLSSHFRAVCWVEDRSLLGYSNVAVSLFFLASGYGMFHSLSRRLGASAGPASWLGGFWRDRLARLYPQYVLAVALIALLFGREVAWWQFLGVDSPYWTIGQALQCYVAAPLCFAAAFSSSLAVRIAPLAGWAVLNAAVLATTGDVDRSGMLGQFVYRNLYGTHLALFHLGMLAAARPRPADAFLARAGAAWCTLGFLCMLVVTGMQGSRALAAVTPWLPEDPFPERWTALFPGLEGHGAAWASGVLTVLCVAGGQLFFRAFLALPKGQTLPLGRALAFLGRHSLPVYLFEPLFYLALFELSVLEARAWTTLAWVLGLSPMLMAGCAAIQKIQGLAMRRLTGRV